MKILQWKKIQANILVNIDVHVHHIHASHTCIIGIRELSQKCKVGLILRNCYSFCWQSRMNSFRSNERLCLKIKQRATEKKHLMSTCDLHAPKCTYAHRLVITDIFLFPHIQKERLYDDFKRVFDTVWCTFIIVSVD